MSTARGQDVLAVPAALDVGPSQLCGEAAPLNHSSREYGDPRCSIPPLADGAGDPDGVPPNTAVLPSALSQSCVGQDGTAAVNPQGSPCRCSHLPTKDATRDDERSPVAKPCIATGSLDSASFATPTPTISTVEERMGMSAETDISSWNLGSEQMLSPQLAASSSPKPGLSAVSRHRGEEGAFEALSHVTVWPPTRQELSGEPRSALHQASREEQTPSGSQRSIFGTGAHLAGNDLATTQMPWGEPLPQLRRDWTAGAQSSEGTPKASGSSSSGATTIPNSASGAYSLQELWGEPLSEVHRDWIASLAHGERDGC